MGRIIPFGFGVVILLAVAASLRPLEPFLLGYVCVIVALAIVSLLSFTQSRPHFYFGVLTVGILISIAATNWPMRIAYVASSSSFERAASQILGGQKISTPCMVGAFRIAKAEVHYNGKVCFWTDCNPAGRTGFVQCGPVDPPFNLWSHTKLNNSWQFISED